jgi:hypothetical protein
VKFLFDAEVHELAGIGHRAIAVLRRRVSMNDHHLAASTRAIRFGCDWSGRADSILP